MAHRAKDGHKAEKGRQESVSLTNKAAQNPLDFALAIMRDDSKSDALRAAMAKAALPFLHARGEKQDTDEAAEREPASEPMSNLELARRVAHILALGGKQPDREEGESLLPPVQEDEKSPPRHEPPAQPADTHTERAAGPDPHSAYRWIP